MSNVNEAMTNLADAIRGKSGETIKLSLEAMISTVSALETKGEAMKMGMITAAESGVSVTVNHGLGAVPGAILFFKNGTRDSGYTEGTSGVDYGFRESLFAAMLNNDSFVYGYNYVNRERRYSVSGTSGYVITYSGNYNKTSVESTTYGINTVTEESFNTPEYLRASDTYIWIAFKDPLA